MNQPANSSVLEYYSLAQVADILGISKTTLEKWKNNGKLIPKHAVSQQIKQDLYHISQLKQFDIFRKILNSQWAAESTTKPLRPYRLLELFAGAG